MDFLQMVVLIVRCEHVQFLQSVVVTSFVDDRPVDFFADRVYSISSPFLNNKEYY